MEESSRNFQEIFRNVFSSTSDKNFNVWQLVTKIKKI